ncbi:uncharacterized protein SPAPADRAFT_57748, partial [Spathaspora passalidarum NRRL Y-27907]
MSQRKTVFELAAIACSFSKVLGGSIRILERDIAQYPLVKSIREWDSTKPMWDEVQRKAQSKRNSESNVNTSQPPFPSSLNKKGTSFDGTQKRAYSTKPSHEEHEEEHTNVIGAKEKPKGFQMSQSEVPSSRLARIFHYGTLAAGMGYGAAKEGIKGYMAGNSKDITMKGLMLSPGNIERLAKKFSQMRGAALKIGQMLSFQDSSVLPKEIQQILLRVQNSAHYMPLGQLDRVMKGDLGNNWRERLFTSFDDVPIAAASIGQVHSAITDDLTPVVVKVQYPGVVDSIDSDLNNLLMLLTASSLLPAGLFLDKTIANARVELKWECDYIREAHYLVRFREVLQDDPVFAVPKVFHSLCGEHVLTMERMMGTEIVKGDWDQETKDWIATNIMRLCLLEIKKFKFMQTDPNWANFLYNDKTKKI